MHMVSVIIATYNRAPRLQKALESIMCQQAGVVFEILVIDNHSTDHTKSVVAEFAKTSDLVHYVFEPQKGKCFALNTGIGRAKGDIIVFTDDDIVATPTWLNACLRCFETTDCDGVGGRILPQYPNSTPRWLVDNIQLLAGPIIIYDYGKETKKYQKPMYEFLGANFAFRKHVFGKIGLFNTSIGPGTPSMGDDTEFVSRALKAGLTLYYCGEAVVWHPIEPNRMNLKYLAWWYMTLGRYRVISDPEAVLADIKYIFNCPLYLIRLIALQILGIVRYAFNQRKFLENWMQLFINCGRAAEIRQIRFKARKQGH